VPILLLIVIVVADYFAVTGIPPERLFVPLLVPAGAATSFQR